MSVLGELEEAVGQVAERVGPSVVGIGRGRGRGSGVVLADGLVATNAHNIRGEETTVVFAGDRSAVGRVAGVDVDADLAVIAVDTGGAPAVAWADDAEARVGAAVFALANPGGQLRVTFGLVSAVGRAFRGPRGRRIAGSIEHTAPLPRGASGGPVVDSAGRLLGIDTNRLGDGFYLALPADGELRRRLDALGRGEAPARPRLGIGIAPARVARQLRRAVGLPERDGLLVRVVEEGGPADRSGLRAGDLVVEAGGRTVTDADQLYEVLDRLGEDQSLALRVVRGTDELTVTVAFSVGEGAAERVGDA
ncbi:MAG TPA: trypsin-like peptidase domain-containing protein [Actinomycetes bacterium]|jgi:S1-C subfamily serine protease|nr:trypsin-like peptidase domain-containing protein [Actinomycetes bacterium]